MLAIALHFFYAFIHMGCTSELCIYVICMFSSHRPKLNLIAVFLYHVADFNTLARTRMERGSRILYVHLQVFPTVQFFARNFNAQKKLSNR